MVIRTALPGDAPALAALSAELGYPAVPEAIAGRLEGLRAGGAGECFVAEREGAVVGWIHVFATARLESPPAAEIGGLVVGASARAGGVGSALVERAVAWSRERGLERLRVRSRVERSDAHRFYEGRGFERVKTQEVLDRRLA